MVFVAGTLLAENPASQKEHAPAGVATIATFDARNLRAAAEPGPIWLVHAGDDPAYARSDFDDSQWTPFNLKTSLKTVFPQARPEIVWYRIHIQVARDNTGMAISERNVSTAFELYCNGERMLKSGEVAPFKPFTNGARALVALPDSQVATGSLTIALRVYLPRSIWGDVHPGLAPKCIAIGQREEMNEHRWYRIIGVDALYWINLLLVFGLGMVGLALFIAQRQHREYLWIFLQFVAQVATLPWTLTMLFRDIPAFWGLAQLPFNMLNFLFQALMYLAFLRQRLTRWMRIYFGVTGALVAAAVIAVSVGALPTFFLGVTIIPFMLFLNLLVPILLIVHFRRGNREAGILLIPSLLTGASSYIGLIVFFAGEIPALEGASSKAYDLLFGSSAGPFTLSLEDIANLLFNVSLLLILVLRSNRMSRQQAVFESELEAAREVQEVILPEQVEAVPGFTVDSAYQPAQQVGGDFFQVLPDGKGGLLLVLGDVAGKGLPAAMLVSVLVGAVRTVVDYTFAPGEVLASLNERLIGRSRGGFSTALAAHFTADGLVTIANAGHLSPYLDGEEVTLPGALPLGILSGIRYESIQIDLPAGSRLTFYSDGVIEAQNEKDELLGFDRGRELSTQPAAAIVGAAKDFGQSDDITVVVIGRCGEIAKAA